MVRLVIVIAVLGIAVVVVKQRSDAVGVSAPAAPRVNSAQAPEEFRRILADAPDPARILRERGALPGLGAIRRLAGELGAPMTPQERGRSRTSAAGAICARSALTSAATSRRSTA